MLSVVATACLANVSLGVVLSVSLFTLRPLFSPRMSSQASHGGPSFVDVDLRCAFSTRRCVGGADIFWGGLLGPPVLQSSWNLNGLTLNFSLLVACSHSMDACRPWSPVSHGVPGCIHHPWFMGLPLR